MIQNVEIEFKTVIAHDKYQELLTKFNLENNIFKLTNYYFDTDDFELNAQKIVLRIRQKGDKLFKVTLKSQHEKGAYEYHVLLHPDKAKEMIENGFNTKDYFYDIDYFVTFKVSLDNYRVSTPYESGTLFLDRCEYCDVVDYELEYEVSNYQEGYKVFENFLNNHNIKYIQTKRKSERAFAQTR